MNFSAYYGERIAGEILEAIRLEDEIRALVPSEGEDWQRRAAALVALGDQCGGKLPQVLEAAFFDPDSRVRGMAWILISDCWESRTPATELEIVAQAVSEVKRHFEIVTWPGRDTVELRIGQWLDLVSKQVLGYKLMERARQARARLIRAYAGEDFTELIRNPDAAGRLLGDADPRRRAAALLVIAKRRNNMPSILDRIASLAVRDPNPIVRREAVAALTAKYFRSRDAKIMRLLAGIVQNNAETLQVRSYAYNGLCVVDDKPQAEIPLVKARDNTTTVLLGVDWDYVRRCATP